MSANPHPSIVIRIGRKRLTLTWRPRKRLAGLLMRLLSRMWRAMPRVAQGAIVAASGGAMAAGPAMPALPANALPTGGTVAAGSANITQTGNSMTVYQGSDKAILNWNTFNIGSQASVTFQQPNANSVALNRVSSNDPSLLQGTLTGNGKVWLINPAGIMVGQGARIDLQGFVASSLAIRDEDFLGGRFNFQSTPNAGAVHNAGTITTPSGGSVYLVAPNVENSGVIRAPNGEVILAAGQSVSLVDTATPGVRVEITGAEGNVTNLGSVVSEAGRIGMAGVMVKNSGTLNANSVVSEGGRIFLRATKDAVVDGSASVSATGTKGGQVEVTGERVGVLGNASVDASGTNGGGTVLVGGDYQGGNAAVKNAQTAAFAEGASIKADATTQGDGGKVVVWSDGTTLAAGSISATGGSQGGNGGLVETSGKGHLSVNGLRADTTAARGTRGTLLLDPTNLVIGSTASIDGSNSSDIDSVAPVSGLVSLASGDHAGATSQITGAALGSLLNTSNVSLAASNDITVSSSITKTSGGAQSLTLTAGNDINVNADITSTAGALGLNLSAGNSIAGTAAFNLNGGAVNLTATNGSINLSSTGGLTLGNTVSAQGNITLQSGGTLQISAGLTSLAGTIYATGGSGIELAGTVASAGAQTYGSNVSLTGNTTLQSGGQVGFFGTVNSSSGNHDLSITNTGRTRFSGSVGATGALGNLSLTGTSALTGPVTTTGTQTYGGTVALESDIVLTAGGQVALSGGVAGFGTDGFLPRNLTVQGESVQSGGSIANVNALSVTATSGGITLGTTSASSVTVNATGSATLDQSNTIGSLSGNVGGSLSARGVQAVGGAVTAGSDITLRATPSGSLNVQANVTSTAGNVTLLADDLDVTNGSVVRSGTGSSNFVKVNTLSSDRVIQLSSLTNGSAGSYLLLDGRDLAGFATPKLIVGDSAHVGAMTLVGGGQIAAAGVTGTLQFINNGSFTRNSTESFTVNGLDITARGGINLTGGNQVTSFKASNSNSGNISFTNSSGANTLQLAGLTNTAAASGSTSGNITIDNTGGVAVGNLVATTGAVSITAHSPITVASNITAGTGISLTASTHLTIGAGVQLLNTSAAPITLLAQNGPLVVDASASINSGGGAISLTAQGSTGSVTAPGGVFSGATPTITQAFDAAADAAAKAAADAAAAAAAQAAAEAAAKAAADAAAQKAAEDAAAKAAADAAAKKAAEEAAAKAAAEAAAKKAAEEAAAKAAAEAAAQKAAEDAAAKAAADAAAKKAAEDAAAKAAADAAAKKAAEDAAAKAAADAAAKKAAEDAAAKAAADAAAKKAAEEAAAKAAAEAAAKAAAEEAARQAAEIAAKAAAAAAAAKEAAAAKAAADAKSESKSETKTTGTSNTPTTGTPPTNTVLAQVFESQTVGGGDNSFGGSSTSSSSSSSSSSSAPPGSTTTSTASGDSKPAEEKKADEKKEEKKDDKKAAEEKKADEKKETKKLAVCK